MANLVQVVGLEVHEIFKGDFENRLSGIDLKERIMEEMTDEKSTCEDTLSCVGDLSTLNANRQGSKEDWSLSHGTAFQALGWEHNL